MSATKQGNPWAKDLASRGRKGGPHMDRKKEASRKACRMPVEDEQDYEICNCDQAIYYKELLEDVVYEKIELDPELEKRILEALARFKR